MKKQFRNSYHIKNNSNGNIYNNTNISNLSNFNATNISNIKSAELDMKHLEYMREKQILEIQGFIQHELSGKLMSIENSERLLFDLA